MFVKVFQKNKNLRNCIIVFYKQKIYKQKFLASKKFVANKKFKDKKLKNNFFVKKSINSTTNSMTFAYKRKKKKRTMTLNC